MKYKELVDNINKHHYKIEPMYLRDIERLKEVREDLNNLEVAQHLLGVVKPFLIKWGRMSRVVGRDGLNWEKFGEILRSLEKEFGKLRRRRFLTIDYCDETVSDAVIAIYEKLDPLPYLGGPTTISKILHLLNPEIFVMWDNGIRKRYRNKNGLIRSNPIGYLEFLKETQKEIREALCDRQKETGKRLDEIEEEIRNTFDNMSLARIIDKYNIIE